jgi:pyridoxine 5-phosphate synthase
VWAPSAQESELKEPRRLVVNVDHVATLRQARGGAEPDPVAAALLALAGRADGIVVHLREDRRHIQDRDLRLLRQVVHRRLVLEMAATAEMQKIALETKPDSITLVPERRAELTTEGGLDVIAAMERLKEYLKPFADARIRTCVFVEPEPEQIKAVHRIGAQAIELHTGRYANVGPGAPAECERIRDAARLGARLGLEVGAGHGLDYLNVTPLCGIEEIREFSIGHSILARALAVGLERAVSEMKALVG